MKTLFKLSFCICFILLSTQCSQNYLSQKPVSVGDAASLEAPLEYSKLLAKYVKSNGVAYSAWHDSREDLLKLKKVVQVYSQQKAPQNRESSLAWHLNAYNAWILHEILEAWPTKGPFDVSPLFFHGKRIRISGKKMSFQHLENKIIRPKFQEPRIHFALNCASRSCPPLHDKPFRSSDLDRTLDQLARDFLNENSLALELHSDKVKVSRIFKWYAEDFEGEKGVIPYVNRYRTIKISNGLGLDYLKYDWMLNSSS